MQYNPRMRPEATFLALLDRQLRHQPGACACLARHAGKTVCLRLPLLTLGFAVTEAGGVTAVPPGTEAATEITLAPATLIALAFGERDALKNAAVRGDGMLAADLSAALNAFDWVLALRPYLGDIAATRAAQVIGELGAWRRQAQTAAGRAFAEYATYEADMLIDKASAADFVAGVDALRDDVARLEARIDLHARQRG
jgi:ubiquinone biosynthesis protein UbiJ